MTRFTAAGFGVCLAALVVLSTLGGGATTSAEELAKVAVQARPKLLILYHQRDSNEEGLRIVRARFQGPVVVANDLQVFE